MEKEQKAPYYLVVHTNSYVGNFERELVAFSVGKLDEEQDGYAREYSKAFWNSVVGSDIDSLEDYEAMCEECEELEDSVSIASRIDKLLSNLTPEDAASDKEEIRQEEYDHDVRRLYDTYLCNTYREVDDWEQNIFYYIDSYYKNSTYPYLCDSIYIQLNKPLNEALEETVMKRIKMFFASDAYNIIRDYQWLCQLGTWDARQERENLELFDLELVDSDMNLIKKYV